MRLARWCEASRRHSGEGPSRAPLPPPSPPPPPLPPPLFLPPLLPPPSALRDQTRRTARSCEPACAGRRCVARCLGAAAARDAGVGSSCCRSGVCRRAAVDCAPRARSGSVCRGPQRRVWTTPAGRAGRGGRAGGRAGERRRTSRLREEAGRGPRTPDRALAYEQLLPPTNDSRSRQRGVVTGGGGGVDDESWRELRTVRRYRRLLCGPEPPTAQPRSCRLAERGGGLHPLREALAPTPRRRMLAQVCGAGAPALERSSRAVSVAVTMESSGAAERGRRLASPELAAAAGVAPCLPASAPARHATAASSPSTATAAVSPVALLALGGLAQARAPDAPHRRALHSTLHRQPRGRPRERQDADACARGAGALAGVAAHEEARTLASARVPFDSTHTRRRTSSRARSAATAAASTAAPAAVRRCRAAAVRCTGASPTPLELTRWRSVARRCRLPRAAPRPRAAPHRAR